MKGFLLKLTAIIILILLYPFSYIYGIFISIKRNEFSNWHLKLAISIDQFGNVLCKYLFNLLLIKNENYFIFGNEDETISSVIGKNKVHNNLTYLGTILDNVLDKIDNNHSIKNIEKDE